MEKQTLHTDVLDHGFVELQDWMGDDLAVVQAARVSTLKESKGPDTDKKLIYYLMANGHTSPFEQVEFKFRIKCPIFVARQILRHRTANINEVSRRYTSEKIEFHIPEFFRKQADSNKQCSTDEKIEYLVDDYGYCDADGEDYQGVPVKSFMQEYVDYAEHVYNDLLAQGVAREQARMILPMNLYTMFIFKIDLHNLLHFLDVRSSEHAQWETRQYAFAMMEMVKEIVPVCYQAWIETYKKEEDIDP